MACLLMLVIAVAVLKPEPAHGTELVVQDAQSVESLTGPMAINVEVPPAQIAEPVPVLPGYVQGFGPLPDWVSVLLAVLYGLSHVMARLPASMLRRWPGWLQLLLSFVAANYGTAKNRDEPGWMASRPI